MKQFIIFLSIIFSCSASFAQDKDIATASFKVEGNCNMCKKRIEDAAYIKGVKRADWNKDSHELTLIYKPSKTSPETILKSVAHAGHSSEKIAASDAEYHKLPECCHYKTNTCEH